jgi:nuclear transport factor 2 (NTF2) superfamily protein
VEKVRLAEDGWNSRDPEKVSLAYTVDSYWRNRTEFAKGYDEIVALWPLGRRPDDHPGLSDLGLPSPPREDPAGHRFQSLLRH